VGTFAVRGRILVPAVRCADRLSTRTLQILRNCLERAIRHAEVRDLVGRNVAAVVKPPRGTAGRPSKSLTLEQAQMLLLASRDSRLHAYVVLSVMTGLRTEELRALRWSEVHLDAGAVAVYRSVRVTGDTKTRKSRRVLGPQQLAKQTLYERHKLQAWTLGCLTYRGKAWDPGGA
jgi:integrase